MVYHRETVYNKQGNRQTACLTAVCSDFTDWGESTMAALNVSMEVSLQSIMRNEDLDFFRENGLKYLAIPFSFYDQDPQVIKERSAEIRNRGFVFDTCHPPFGGGNQRNSLCAEDEKIRQETIVTYTYYIQKFSETGMRAIPVHTGGAMHPAGGRKALDRLTDTLTRLLPEAEKTGVILALENTFYSNPCPFTDAPNPSGVDSKYINDDCEMLVKYVQEWNSPWIKICHDVGHSLLFGHRIQEDLPVLAPLTVLYHIQDNDGIEDRHWNVGEGILPWKLLHDSLVERNFEYALFDEVLCEKNPALQLSMREPAQLIGYYKRAFETINA